MKLKDNYKDISPYENGDPLFLDFAIVPALFSQNVSVKSQKSNPPLGKWRLSEAEQYLFLHI